MTSDLPVSEVQRRATHAAAGEHSTLGIPRKVGREFVGKDWFGGDWLRRVQARDAEWEEGEDEWTDEAREAALEARRRGAKKKANKPRIASSRVEQESMLREQWAKSGREMDYEDVWNDKKTERAWNDEIAEWNKRNLLDQINPDPDVDYHFGSHPEFERYFDDKYLKGKMAPFPGVKRSNEYFEEDGSPGVYLHKREVPGYGDERREHRECETFGNKEYCDEEGEDSFSFDRAGSARIYDADGRLHVENTNISKANICSYVGREIPNYEGLGLDATRQYRLYRDPTELTRGAATFNNIPVLSEHVPVSAEHHRPELVIGSTGTDAVFDGTYLKNSLVFWAGSAIDMIEDEEQRQLSCAYRYRADMTPGTVGGQPYDGVMRDIVGNHVALVREGRAGRDVMVGDMKPGDCEDHFGDEWSEEARKAAAEARANKSHENTLFNRSTNLRKEDEEAGFQKMMKFQRKNKGKSYDPTQDGAAAMDVKQVLTRKAAAAHGAVHAFLYGKLAQDSELDLTPLFSGVTAENYAEMVPEVAAGISRLARGHLAQGAKLDGLREVLLAMDTCAMDEDEDEEDKKKAEDDWDDEEDKKKQKEAEDRRRAADAAETDEEKKVRMDRRARDKKAWDASEEETDEEKERRMAARGDKRAKDKSMGRDELTLLRDEPRVRAADIKIAVDSAVSMALDGARKQHVAFREAERAVRPYVGEIAVEKFTCDSADAVYATALKMRGVETKGVHPSAYPAMLKMLSLAGARAEKSTYAQDAAASADFNTRHPEVARIRCV